MVNLPYPGMVCRVNGPERRGRFFRRWIALVDYAWTWQLADGQLANGIYIGAITKARCERKAAREIALFHAFNGPSFEWTKEQQEHIESQMTDMMRRGMPE